MSSIALHTTRVRANHLVTFTARWPLARLAGKPRKGVQRLFQTAYRYDLRKLPLILPSPQSSAVHRYDLGEMTPN